MKKSTKKTTVKITAPNKKSTLSPVQAFFQKKFNIKPLPLNPEEKFENTYSTDNFKYKSVNMIY